MTNLINFTDEVTGLTDEGRTVGVVSLDYSKAFDTVSYKILTDKVLMYGLHGEIVRWVENWLNG